MNRWTGYCTNRAKRFKEKQHAEIAAELEKSPKAVAEWLRTHGMKKCPNYTEMEIYLLSNFKAKYCQQYIPHKTLNALKIKQCRLKRSTRASASIR